MISAHQPSLDNVEANTVMRHQHSSIFGCVYLCVCVGCVCVCVLWGCVCVCVCVCMRLCVTLTPFSNFRGVHKGVP